MRLHASSAGVWAQSLVGELGSHMLRGVAKKKERMGREEMGKVSLNNFFLKVLLPRSVERLGDIKWGK